MKRFLLASFMLVTVVCVSLWMAEIQLARPEIEPIRIEEPHKNPLDDFCVPCDVRF